MSRLVCLHAGPTLSPSRDDFQTPFYQHSSPSPPSSPPSSLPHPSHLPHSSFPPPPLALPPKNSKPSEKPSPSPSPSPSYPPSPPPLLPPFPPSHKMASISHPPSVPLPPMSFSSVCLHFLPLFSDFSPGGLNAVFEESKSQPETSTWYPGVFQWLTRGKINEEDIVKRAENRLLLTLLGTPLAAQTTHFRVSPESTSEVCIPEKALALQVVKQFLSSSSLGASTSSETVGRSRWVSGKLTMWPSEVKIRKNKVFSCPFPTTENVPFQFSVVQVHPNNWATEMRMGEERVGAGCDGMSLWRSSSWEGSWRERGMLRPLRRLLQGLDPRAIARAFSTAVFVCEQEVDGEECNVIKVNASQSKMAEMTKLMSGGEREGEGGGGLEVVVHEMEGSFSVQTGYLLRLRDRHVVKRKRARGRATFWEYSTDSRLSDYRNSGGFSIAHSGHTALSLVKFEESMKGHLVKIKVEEIWTIENVIHDPKKMAGMKFNPPSVLKEWKSEQTWPAMRRSMNLPARPLMKQMSI